MCIHVLCVCDVHVYMLHVYASGVCLCTCTCTYVFVCGQNVFMTCVYINWLTECVHVHWLTEHVHVIHVCIIAMHVLEGVNLHVYFGLCDEFHCVVGMLPLYSLTSHDCGWNGGGGV